MGLLANFSIAGSAVSAQSVRLNTIASNLANVETVASSEAEAYRSRQPVFQAMMEHQQRPADTNPGIPWQMKKDLSLPVTLIRWKRWQT